MAKGKSKVKAVSSPAATGGAGNSFEQHAVAHWGDEMSRKISDPFSLDGAFDSLRASVIPWLDEWFRLQKEFETIWSPILDAYCQASLSPETPGLWLQTGTHLRELAISVHLREEHIRPPRDGKTLFAQNHRISFCIRSILVALITLDEQSVSHWADKLAELWESDTIEVRASVEQMIQGLDQHRRATIMPVYRAQLRAELERLELTPQVVHDYGRLFQDRDRQAVFSTWFCAIYKPRAIPDWDREASKLRVGNWEVDVASQALRVIQILNLFQEVAWNSSIIPGDQTVGEALKTMNGFLKDDSPIEFGRDDTKKGAITLVYK